MPPNKHDKNTFARNACNAWHAVQAEAEDAVEEVDEHEETRRNLKASLLAQEALTAPDAYVIDMLKTTQNSFPKEKPPLTAQQAFGKGEGGQERERERGASYNRDSNCS